MRIETGGCGPNRTLGLSWGLIWCPTTADCLHSKTNRNTTSVSIKSITNLKGFNGKEKDDEVNGGGNIYDYGFRVYNPRLGKFLSVDPLTNSYPWYTPYQFAGNQSIISTDLDGLEAYPVNPETNASDPNILALNTFSRNFNDLSNDCWNRSINYFDSNGRKSKEHGFVVWNYEDKTWKDDKIIKVVSKIRAGQIQYGENAFVNLDFTPVFGNTVGPVGDLHTHPYESTLNFGLPHSVDDVLSFTMLDGLRIVDGYISMVESGDKRYALVVSDAEKTKNYFKTHTNKELKKLYEKGFKAYKGSDDAEARKAGLLNMLKDSGIDFYESKNEQKTEFQKATVTN